MVNRLIRPSKKRLLLAAYVDFLLFSTVLALGSRVLMSHTKIAWWHELALFAVLEAVLYRADWSPGLSALGIRRVSRHASALEDDDSMGTTLLSVEPRIYDRESWVTVLLGVGSILGGTKAIARWAQGAPSPPAFGIQADPTSLAVLTMVGGVLSVLLGYLFLRLEPAALWLALSLVSIAFIAHGMSWSQWDGYAREMVLHRRALQGIRVRRGEVEFIQALLPEALLCAELAALPVLLAVRKRLLWSVGRACARFPR